MSWGWQPKTGDILLFPSGTMHMVEPNTTDKDRYSISFNIEIQHPNGETLIEDNGEEWHKENTYVAAEKSYQLKNKY